MTRQNVPIKLLAPQLPSADRLKVYLEQIDKAQQYTNFGPQSTALEAALPQVVGSNQGVCVSSGTAALELGLASLDLPAGSQVALPSLNFPSAGLAILRNGFTPIFCDVDPATGLLPLEGAYAVARTRKIAAIMPSCLFGCGYDTELWDEFTRTTGIPVLMDSAGAIGYQPAGRNYLTAYSLHATKPLSSGEGGFLATSDSDLADRVRTLSNFGFTERGIFSIGTNAKLSEYHSAIALAALETWEEDKAKYLELFQMYHELFEGYGALRHAPIVNQSGISGTLTIRLSRPLKADDIAQFSEAGIETRRWYYPPLHYHELFASCPRNNTLENTENLALRLLGLPYHLGLKRAEIDVIARTVSGLF